MFENYKYKGRTLKDWQKDMAYEYSLGELYRMAKEGRDFEKLVKKGSAIESREEK